MNNQFQAQQRVDQIESFNQELQQLELEGVLALSEDDKQSVNLHHAKLIASLQSAFDIDATTAGKQFTLGMKIASFLGALAFAASIFYLFYYFWGFLSTTTQTVILLCSPLVALAMTWGLLKNETSGYLAKVSGVLTVVCFVLNLVMLAQIYSLPPSPYAMICWCLLSLGLAYLTHSRLLLVAAIVFFSGFLAAKMTSWMGGYWVSFGSRPENFFIPALFVFALGHQSQPSFSGFAAILRIFGLLILFTAMLILAHWAGGSYLNYGREFVEGCYQVLGLVLSAGVIWYGIKRSWQDTVNTGVVCFVFFLYSKLFTWWDLFPKYLFFLLIALSALLILLIFKRLRLQMAFTEGVRHD